VLLQKIEYAAAGHQDDVANDDDSRDSIDDGDGDNISMQRYSSTYGGSIERDTDMDGHDDDDDNDNDKNGVLPSEWLQEICIGSLTNAGCNLLHLSNYLERRASSSSSPPPHQYGDTSHSLADYEYNDHDYGDVHETKIDSTSQDNNDYNAMFRDYQDEEELLQNRILSTAPSTGGIDFDLLVPALLLLQRRGDGDGGDYPWRTIMMTAGGITTTRTTIAPSSAPTDNTITQSILNAACHLAGRQTLEEPYYAFDAGRVMRQCAMLENVLAASYLIGGHDGLILRCAHILLCKDEKEDRDNGICIGSVDEAENFLLHSGGCGGICVVRSVVRPTQAQERYDDGDSATTAHNDGYDDADNDADLEDDFILTEGHRQLLWLLERYVLSVTKYGQFTTTTTALHDRDIRRGATGIDPVFCAQICLRAWIWLSSTSTTTRSTDNNSGRWLADWLERRLIGTTNSSTRRGDNINLTLNTTTTTIMACPPKKRLACAALTRALLWNDDDDDDDNDYEDVSNNTNYKSASPTRSRQRQKRRQKRRPVVLAESLGFDTRFIVFLAQASCGLVECIPSPIADAMMRMDNKDVMMKSTSTTTFLSKKRIDG